MATLDTDPFAPVVRPVTDTDPSRQAMAAAGPVVALPVPAGGSAWVVTDVALAREVLHHPDIVKDTAWAPEQWDPRVAGLEPPAAAQSSLTTAEGPAHTALRRAHAPLFTGRRMRAEHPRVTSVARELLAAERARGSAVDLMADFTTRFPLTVLLDLLGAPRAEVDRAAAACRDMFSDDPAVATGAIAGFFAVADAALAGDGWARELGERLPGDATRDDLRYHLFALIFAGQLTTDAALGEVLLAALDPRERREPAELVEDVLRVHPPAPFTLWRFTRTDVELAGHRLPPRSPVLVDLQGIGRAGTAMAFGAGPHVCVGAQLARLELCCAVEVLRADHPRAVLDADVAELRRAGTGGTTGHRIVALPVRLDG